VGKWQTSFKFGWWIEICPPIEIRSPCAADLPAGHACIGRGVSGSQAIASSAWQLGNATTKTGRLFPQMKAAVGLVFPCYCFGEMLASDRNFTAIAVGSFVSIDKVA
jgi:hypothetical protein